MRNILAVGAYERDNFGDYLFLEVLRRALPDDNIIPGSVIYSNMIHTYGIIVYPYDVILENNKVDAIWVVGGEVGSITTYGALSMSLEDKVATGYESVSTEHKQKIDKIMGAAAANIRAYIPDPSIYSKNKTTPLIINSVGLSFTGNDAKTIKNLKQKTEFIGVRESESYRWAEKNGIKVALYPDAVHSLGAYYKPKRIADVGVLFQINENLATAYGTKNISDMLAGIYHDSVYKQRKITLISAGTARHHDNYKIVEDIYNNLRANGVRTEIIASRKPLDIVDYIASADIVISSSLHVRIVAITYDVARISLENTKVGNYASFWDANFPYNVKIDKVIDVIKKIKVIQTNDNLNAKKLTKKAVKSIEDASTRIPVSSESETINLNTILQKYLKNTIDSSIETVILLAKVDAEKEKHTEEIRSLRKLRNDLSKNLNDIKKSKAWRLIEAYRRFKSKLIQQNKSI